MADVDYRCKLGYEQIMTWTLDGSTSLAMAGIALLAGEWLLGRVKLLGRYNIPAAVVGGLSAALLLLALRRWGGIEVQLSKQFQVPLMTLFFASVGWSAGLGLIRAGGKHLVTFLGWSSLLLVVQNLVGSGLARAFGLPPLFGVLSGSVALAGGPGTALAFAPSFEQAGVVGAPTIGLAAALAGILLGGLTGAPVATWLSERGSKVKAAARGDVLRAKDESKPPALTVEQGIGAITALLVSVALGEVVSTWLKVRGALLPGYFGALLIGFFWRGLQDAWSAWRGTACGFSVDGIEWVGNLALSFFLGLSLLTLDLSQLLSVAGPLAASLVVQTALLLAFSSLVIFRWYDRRLGRQESAALTAGFIGFMLGTTANAMSNLDAVRKRLGHAPRAAFIVPVVGSCFLDVVNAAVITAWLGWGRG